MSFPIPTNMTYQRSLTQNDFRLKQRAILERCLEVNEYLQMPRKKFVNECLNQTLSTFEALSAGYITLSISVLENFTKSVRALADDSNVLRIWLLTDLNYLILGDDDTVEKVDCLSLQDWQKNVLMRLKCH